LLLNSAFSTPKSSPALAESPALSTPFISIAYVRTAPAGMPRAAALSSRFGEKARFRFFPDRSMLLSVLSCTASGIINGGRPMAKGTFATAILLALASGATFAQPSRSDDGCGVLQRLVQNGVHAAATQFAVHRVGLVNGRNGINPSRARRQLCRSTVEATTRAFGEALAALNMSVRWNGPMDPGDYCLSGDLSQCYPGPRAGEPMPPSNQLAFVYDAWKGVRNAVASQMPLGTASGVSAFTPASLDSALSSNLGETVDGPLHSGYAGARKQ
jgi:hypothetical protein